MKWQLLSRVPLFVIPWAIAHQASLCMEFSRQEYWSGLPFPSPGDLPNRGIEPGSPALQADSLPTEPPEKPRRAINRPHRPLIKGFYSAGHRCNGLRWEVPWNGKQGMMRDAAKLYLWEVSVIHMEPVAAIPAGTRSRWNRTDQILCLGLGDSWG